jgi:hypothetical protein
MQPIFEFGLDVDLETATSVVRQTKIEGLVAKRLGSKYHPGIEYRALISTFLERCSAGDSPGHGRKLFRQLLAESCWDLIAKARCSE